MVKEGFIMTERRMSFKLRLFLILVMTALLGSIYFSLPQVI